MSLRGSSWYKLTAIVTMIVYSSVPLLAQSQISKTDYFEGRLAGQMAASGDPLWFFGGFCLSGLGIIMALSIKPAPQTGHLVGKSPGYIQGYIEGYKDRASEQNTNYALAGFATAIALYVVILIAFLYSTLDTMFDNF